MNRTYLKSLAELVAITYAVAFLGLITADGFDIVSVGAWKAAAVAAFPPVLSAVYGVVARLKGNFNSALAVDTREDI